MLECLAKGPSDSRLVLNSNTANFKLIPFANKTFSTDQTTALIQKQNDFLHNTKAISIVNLSSLEGIFTDKDKRMQDEGNKKRDAANITSDDGMEIEDEDDTPQEDSLMSNANNRAYNDDSDNDGTEEGNEEESKKKEAASSSVCLLQLIFDAQGSCSRTGEATELFQTIESGRNNQFYLTTHTTLLAQAEQWVDNTFDYFLQTYGPLARG